MKRFYKHVTATPVDGGWQVQLDGRGIRTQGGAQQVVPNEQLARALAAEWEAQGEELDPKSFTFRDMADYAIDKVTADRSATLAAILPFAETDTLCYRADPDEALFKRQQDLWEPLVCAREAASGVRFERVSGIIHRKQPDATLAKLAQELEALDPFTLAAVQTIASLTASLVIALAALDDGADADRLFAAANAEQDWQAELWGWEYSAEDDRAIRLAALRSAMEFARMAREG